MKACTVIKPSYLPGDKKNKEMIENIVRVNHSGEYGAVKIYLGQIKATKHREFFQKIFFNKNNTVELLNILNEMYQQEIPHYQYFKQLINELKIRPSIFLPLWSLLGFFSGYFSSLLGKSVAMTCTTGIEEVIGKHYSSQLSQLNQMLNGNNISYDNNILNNLSKNITQFMYDELEHLNTGIEYGAQSMYGHFYLNVLVKFTTKVAILVAKRF